MVEATTALSWFAPLSMVMVCPALKPIALAAVHACRRVTQLPIVGMGGIGRKAISLNATGRGLGPSTAAQARRARCTATDTVAVDGAVVRCDRRGPRRAT